MTPATAPTAPTFESCFLYEDCTIPAGLTLTEWRREARGPHSARRGFVRSLVNRLLP
jgi:hypothetical protein